MFWQSYKEELVIRWMVLINAILEKCWCKVHKAFINHYLHTLLSCCGYILVSYLRNYIWNLSLVYYSSVYMSNYTYLRTLTSCSWKLVKQWSFHFLMFSRICSMINIKIFVFCRRYRRLRNTKWLIFWLWNKKLPYDK